MQNADNQGNALSQLFKALLNRWKMIITTVLVATILVLVVSLALPKVYKSSFLVESQIITETQAKSLIDNLSDAFNGRKQLSGVAIPAALSGKVDKLILSPVKDAETTTFRVMLFVYDPTLTDSLMTFTLQYLNDNPYVMKKVNLEKQMRQNLQEVIAGESEAIKKDPQATIDAGKDRSVNLYTYEKHKEYVDIKEQQFTLEKELSELEGFTLIEPAMKPLKPYSPAVLLNTLLALVASTLIACSIAVVAES